MKRSPLSAHPCSIARALDIVGEWWTLLVLRDVAYGVRRFREIQEDLGVSANVLSDRLETLVDAELLETRVYQLRPERREYRLTEKGFDLVPALLALMRWGDKWTWGGLDGPVRVVHDQCEHEVEVEVRCPHCGCAAAPAELRAEPRTPLAIPPAEHEPGYVSARLLYGTPGGIHLEGIRQH
jgi:DNA-binding HxlR family transcriptional regulator